MWEHVLTTGAGGMVGSYVNFGARLGHQDLDVTNLTQVLEVCERLQPRVILHLAAETDLDRCEQDPDHAYRVNAVGTYNMAYAARKCGAKLVYLSTSGIFSGDKKSPYTEDDVPDPNTVYGHSKYLGELAVQSMLHDYLIARVAWVFGGGPERDQKFVGKVLHQVAEGKDVRAIRNTKGSPTYGKDVISGIQFLVEKGERGIVHMANEGVATRYDMAAAIVEVTQAPVQVIELTEGFGDANYARVHSPANHSILSRLNVMRGWEAALRDYVQQEWSHLLPMTDSD